MKAQKESRGITTLSLISALDGGGWVTRHPGRFTPRERYPLPIVYGVVWAPGPVWTGAENLSHTGNRSPDCPTRSESLYGLSYRGPRITENCMKLSVPCWGQATECHVVNMTLIAFLINGSVGYLFLNISRVTVLKGRWTVKCGYMCAWFLHTCWVRGHKLTAGFYYLLFVSWP